jgi:hypothetical protein
LLAFLDPFVETFVENAGFAFLFAFLVETYAFGMYSAFGPRLLAACPKRIKLFSGGLLAQLPLLKPSFPLTRRFKLQNLFCPNSTVSKWD